LEFVFSFGRYPNDESADENEDKKKIESELETKADTFENHHTKRDRPSNKSERNERIEWEQTI